jgi:rSAM/selenodomain-associated transferase 1
VRRALVVVGKAPEPGRAKTRLVPPLSEIEAAEVAWAFLQDTCAMALGLGWEQVSVVHPPWSVERLSTLPVRLVPQRGQGLGDALAAAFDEHAQFEQTVLIGSDTPDLPMELVEQASQALAGSDVVIGPAADGGYYLLGMHRPHPGLFEAIAWSTARVYAQTLARAEALGLRTAVLPTWADVDTPDDLRRLERRLRHTQESVAVNTRRVLHRLAASVLAQPRA